MDIENLLATLTVEEKAALVAGTDFMFTNPVPRLNVPSLSTADGPHGLRKQTGKQDNGNMQSEKSTAFPTATATASSWNTENAKRIGAAMAEECLHYGVNVILGPAVNIKRNPLCGRNFEYFSEDAYLAGKMAAAQVAGIQSKGVGACVKHFALNNAEDFRFMGDSVADMRAVREVYLKAFEIIVKEAKPYSLMCAYNKLNGEYCSQNGWLLNEVLRGEWGFDGVVMSDWGAVCDRVAGIKAGLDLEMPGDTKYCRKSIIDGVKSGKLEMRVLDGCVRNILELIEKCTRQKRVEGVDFSAHHALAAEVAADSAVLMKNDGVLPLEKGEKYCIVGDLFQKMRYQGAGSSMINPAMLTTPENAFEEYGVKYEFVRGYAENKLVCDEKLITEAVQKCAEYDKVLVFAGLTDYAESEGGDRESMRLPENQLALVEALVKTGKKIVVVLFGGSAVELPFADGVSAILNMFLPGQNGGTAAYRLLFGENNPCGKLAESWHSSYGCVPFHESFSKSVAEVYKESVLVGYRYYLTAKKRLSFPFGFGLSYTEFEYSDLAVECGGGKIKACCSVKNVGNRDGAEVVQLYVKAPEEGAFKPERELRAFAKLYLKAGETGRAEMVFDADDLKYFNIKENRFVMQGGKYGILVCSDSQTVQLESELLLDGESFAEPYSESVNAIYKSADLAGISDGVFEEMSGLKIPALPQKLPITIESRFTDLNQTFWGRLVFKAVLSMPARQLKKARRLPEGVERENAIKGALFVKRIMETNCLRSMSMATKLLPYNVAEGIVAISNGHILGGIKLICSRIKVPKLPKHTKKRK